MKVKYYLSCTRFRMSIHCLFSGRIPKENEQIKDCQDHLEIDIAKKCCAIADGSSQSFYPGIWAELLVQHFCKNPEVNSSNWEAWLEDIQLEWLSTVRNRVDTAKTSGNPSWIEGINSINLKKSATSTFIGLQFLEDRRIKVCIIGDSCLFVVKGNKVESYILRSSRDFNDRPKYFASYSKDNDFKPDFLDISLDESTSKLTTHLVLATDALSEYILAHSEKRVNIIENILSISSQEQFKDFIGAARTDSIGNMKNDDVALIVIDLNFSAQDCVSPIGQRTYPVQKEAIQGTNSILDNNSTDERRKIPEHPPRLLARLREKLSFSSQEPISDTKNLKLKSSQELIKIIISLKRQRAILILLAVILSILSFWIGSKDQIPSDEDDNFDDYRIEEYKLFPR